MDFEVYQEEDEVLAGRAKLALRYSYSLQEAIKLNNILNLFDTLDGYRIVVIKERDPTLFGFDHPVVHVSIQAQPKSEVLIPQQPAGWVSLAARLLVRLGLHEFVGESMQSQAKGTTIHVWFLVKEWTDQPTQPQLMISK